MIKKKKMFLKKFSRLKRYTHQVSENFSNRKFLSLYQEEYNINEGMGIF